MMMPEKVKFKNRIVRDAFKMLPVFIKGRWVSKLEVRLIIRKELLSAKRMSWSEGRIEFFFRMYKVIGYKVERTWTKGNKNGGSRINYRLTEKV